MFTFGSQINPALGRQDFSAILQGGQARAQGMAQAANIQAQSLAQLGSTIGKGIETYAENKQKNAVLEGKNAQLFNALASDPNTNGVINRSPTIQKLIAQRDQKGGLDFNNNTKLFAELSTAYEMVKESRENQMKQLYAKQAEASVNKMAYELENEKAQNSAWTKYATGVANLPADATIEDRIRLAVSSGMNADQVSKATGQMFSMEQLNLQRQQVALQVAEASTKLAEQARDRDFVDQVLSGKEKGYRVTTDPTTGVRVITNTKTLASAVIPEDDKKPSKGEQAVKYAQDYVNAGAVGDRRAQIEAVINWQAATGNSGPLETGEAFLSRQIRSGGVLPVGGLPTEGAQLPKLEAGVPRKVETPAVPATGTTQAPAQAPARAPAPAANLSLAGATTGFMAGAQSFAGPGQAAAQPSAQAAPTGRASDEEAARSLRAKFSGEAPVIRIPEEEARRTVAAQPSVTPAPVVPANTPAPVVDIAPERSTAQIRADRNEAIADQLRAFGLEAKRVLTPESWRTDENQITYLTDKSKLDTLMSRYDSLSNKKSPTAVRLSNQIDELSKEMAQKRKESEANARKRQMLEALLNQELPQSGKREDRSPGWALRRMSDEQKTKLRKAFGGPGKTLNEMLAEYETMEKRR